MPRPGAGEASAVELAVIAPQFVARLAQLAALFAHFAAIMDDIAVDGMDAGIGRSRPGVGLGDGRGDGGGQGEERSCQQKLAHGILLQSGSPVCDHGSKMAPPG